MTEALDEPAQTAVGAVRTFLIADVRGYTRFTLEHGDGAAAQLTERFADVTRETVAAYEGEVLELRGDEALVAFWSARQALRAAVALQAAFGRQTRAEPNMPLKVGIGLDAGEAVPVEGGYRGAALNLAARLCSLAAPGEVLTSEGVIHLAQKMAGLEYVERGALQLKGFDDPVPVVEIRRAPRHEPAAAELSRAPQEAQRRELPIGGYLGSLPANRVVGREEEIARLLDVIETVINGHGRLVLLVGEPGAGKTRLAQEATLHLRHRDFLIGAGRCYEPQQAVPFYPFVDALTALVTAVPVDLQRAVPGTWPRLSRLLPALGLAVADQAETPDQQRLFWSVTGFLRAVAEKWPVALLLDDLHWADAASLELLQHLARHTDRDRVLLLGTYRDVEVNRRHPLEGALRDLQREGLVERIDVRRLNREETRQLIAAVVGAERVSDEFTDLIYHRTEGNPFFVQQVLRAMVERGDLFRKDGRWDRKTIDEIEVPESVRSVVGQRLSRLAEETQEVLREASVLGAAFSFDDLQAMSGRTEADLERSLEEAMAAGLVRESGRDVYAFDHALTQSTLYGELTSRRRRRLHLQAGQAIEALPEGRREGRAAELAWHFLEGDDTERALQWSMVAGDEAVHVFAHSDAAYHYRTALQLAVEEGSDGLEMQAREKLGRSLSRLAGYREALEVYEPAIAFYRRQGDFEGEIRLMAAIGWIFFEQGRQAEGIERLGPVLERWEQNPVASGSAASLHIALASLYWQAGRLAEGLRLVERAAELATAVGDDRLLGMAESRRGLFLEHLGSSEEALEAYTRSIPLLEAAGELEMLGRSLNNRSLVLGAVGRTAEAWADLERSLAVARRLGDPAQICWALGVLAEYAWSLEGEWDRAEPYVEELLSLERQVRGTRASAFVPLAVWLRLVAGGAPDALGDLERLAAEAEQDGDVNLWQNAQVQLAEWDRLMDRPEQAKARIEAVVQHPGIESQHLPTLEAGLARTFVACGQLEQADALVARLLQQASGSHVDFHRWELLSIRGQIRAAQERWEEAQADFETALAFAREHTLPFGLAEVAFAYGEALAARGDTAAAREQFEEALSIVRRARAQPYVERVERALACLGTQVMSS